jgi:hypothetical protein
MNRRLTLFYYVVVLLITAHRLPAPIVEEQKQTPKPTESAQPKSKPERSKGAEAPADSSAAHRFDGTWQNMAEYNGGGILMRGVFTLVITNGNKAQWAAEQTLTLTSAKTWDSSWFLPAPYDKVSPVSTKWTGESTDLRVEGSNLTVRWPGGRLADWTPKTIPAQLLEKSKFFEHFKSSGKVATFILDGARLISTDGKSSAIWQRVQ